MPGCSDWGEKNSQQYPALQDIKHHWSSTIHLGRAEGTGRASFIDQGCTSQRSLGLENVGWCGSATHCSIQNCQYQPRPGFVVQHPAHCIFLFNWQYPGRMLLRRQIRGRGFNMQKWQLNAQQKGQNALVYPVEIGCRGFVATSMDHICWSSTSYRCWIRLKVGEFEGQDNTWNFLPCSTNNSWTIFYSEWQGALSSWKSLLPVGNTVAMKGCTVHGL